MISSTRATRAKREKAYELLLRKHVAAVSIASNWVGGSMNRDKKGDTNARTPVVPVEAEQQRDVMQIVLDNTMYDDAFGLTLELLQHMTMDRWFDGSSWSTSEEAWPVHARISGIQATALSQLMNPTTINRVYDNEFRADADMDVPRRSRCSARSATASGPNSMPLRIACMMHATPTSQVPVATCSVSTWSADYMSMPENGFAAAAVPTVTSVATSCGNSQNRCRRSSTLHEDELDPYTEAHLQETVAMIDRAMDAQYIYNANEMGGSVITVTRPGSRVDQPNTD